MKEEAKGQNKREIPPSVAAHQMASVTFHEIVVNEAVLSKYSVGFSTPLKY